MRRVLAVLLLLLAWVPARAAAPITVGCAVAGEFLPMFIAVDEGFFARRGLEVKPQALSLLSLAPAALVSDSMQIAATNAPVLLQAAAGGMDLVVVSGTSRHTSANETVSLVARTGSGIQAAADLKGRRVGIPGLGASYDLLFHRWLEVKGVDPEQVTYIEAAAPQMRDLLRGGQLDAVAVLEPIRSRIVEDGTGYRVSDFVIELGPDILAAFWTSTRAWAVAHPQEVAAFRGGIGDGIAFLKQNKARAEEIELKYSKSVSRVRLELTQEVRPADLDFFQDIMLKRGVMTEKVDTAKLLLP